MSDHDVLLDIQVKVNNIYKVLFGNGADPRESIAGRLQALEDSRSADKRFLYLMITLVVATASVAGVVLTAIK